MISKLDAFLSRYFPQKILMLFAGLSIVSSYYLPAIFRNVGLLIIVINFIALLLIKYKLYKFKMNAEDCQELFSYIKTRQNQNSPHDDFYCQQTLNDQGDFLYTEVFVTKNSNLRIPIEAAKLFNLDNAENALIKIKRIMDNKSGTE